MKKILLLTMGVLISPLSTYGLTPARPCASVICNAGELLDPISCTCIGKLPGFDCDKVCPGCTEWFDEDIVPGRQTRNCSELSENCTCLPRLDMRCIAGYWGDPNNGIVCTPCPNGGSSNVPPSVDEWGGTSVQLGLPNYTISGCYQPANTVVTDDTGTYTFTEDCYYTEN